MSPPRILALDDDPLFLRMLGDRLTEAGITFLGIREPTRAVPSAASFNPDLMLLDRHMPVLTGTEVIRSLRAFPETAHVPVVVVTADGSEREVLRALVAGAVDVLHKPIEAGWPARLARLLQELHDARLSAAVGRPSLLVQRLLAFYRRAGRSGTLRLNARTPFEGSALFHDGELVSAELGPVSGVEALEEMVGFEDGAWVFEEKGALPPPPPPAAPETHPPSHSGMSVLFVDDDDDLRQLYQIQLKRSGFEVEVAEDGKIAFEQALLRPFDLVLADLNMPNLDGWGMLRSLRADHRTRDIPVIFLSAHDDYRETLRAAHAGAFDYLAKTGRAEEVVDRVLVALAPRIKALDALKAGGGKFQLRNVGPQWLIRRLGELKATGRLQARDGWGQYTLAFRGGVPIGAKALSAGREATGLPAVAALLVSKDAEAIFEKGSVSENAQLTPNAPTLLARAAATLNQIEARVTDGKLGGAELFDVDEELYALFRKVGNDRQVILARALCDERIPPKELASRLGVPADEVREGLKELLRRRVISFRGEA